MQQIDLTITNNKQLTNQVYLMELSGSIEKPLKPGQFINLSISNLYLRRPISVCDYKDNLITIIYKVVGKGTEILSKMESGQIINTLTNLGNGFNVQNDAKKPLLIGGGVGVPPLYFLAKELIKLGKKPNVILGFNNKDEAFFEEEFKQLGIETYITTVDGSKGKKGFVTDILDSIEYDYFYTCGPKPMLKAIYNKSTKDGEFSFEERMGCGFGACMGCSIKTKNGNKRICKEGPVFLKEEIIWED